MNNDEKAKIYSDLMGKFDILRNKIADIKLTQVNLTEQQLNQVQIYESQQKQIMSQINRLF